MELMKDINELTKSYVPAEEPIEEGTKTMMLKAMDADRAKRKIEKDSKADNLDLSKKRKPKHIKEYIKIHTN